MPRTLCVLALLLCGAIARGENLVANPGFETAAPAGKALAAWGLPRKKGARFRVDDAVARTGKRSARVDGLDAEKQDRFVQAWRQDVPVPRGVELLLSLWVKAERLGSGRVNVLHKDKSGKVLVNEHVASFNGTFGWREVAAPLRQIPHTVKVQLVLGLQKSRGTLWLDDVSLTPMGEPGEMRGRVKMTPAEPQLAGSTVPVRFEFTLGRRGLRPGGRLALRWERWRPAREFPMRKFRVACGQKDAKFQVELPPRKKTWPPIRKPFACLVTMAEGTPLPAGAEVTVAAELRYAPGSNVISPLIGMAAPEKGSALRPLAGSFHIQPKGGSAAKLLCIAEARPIAGKPGRLVVAVTDRYGNPSADFHGTARLAANTKTDLPAEYTFTEMDAGSHAFAVTCPAGQVTRITVTSGKMTATSNPILPRRQDEPGIYFGDIHVHCEVSADAVGDPDLAYDHARRFCGLDFAALSDHSPHGAKWKRIIEVGNRHNKPGEFVTILAFEWSDPRRGHRNAYYPGDLGPEQPRLPNNMEAWWKFFDDRKVRVITIPHHPNTQSSAKRPDGQSVWGPMNWSVINHKYQRVVELNQNRGSFEVPGGPIPELRVVRADCGSSVQAALAKGHRLGFIGSTDAHNGRPGSGPARCVILSNSFTRRGLWEALYRRRCYATSGAHILVLFTLNGQPMGTEFQAENAAAPREVAWRVVGTGPIRRIDLIRSNKVVMSWNGNGQADLASRFRFVEPLKHTEWWYLRVIQEDTQMAWSSPVWVDPATKKRGTP